MAEADLKKAILERIQEEREVLLNQARQEAEEILSQAKKEAASLEERHLIDIKKDCLFKQTKEFNSLIQETKRQLLEAKEKRILKVFYQVKEDLKAMHQDKARYKDILKNLLAEAWESFEKNTKLKLKVNPIDEHLARELLKELKLEAKLETNKAIAAGLELCDLEENMIILNTFESRLSKIMPQLRQAVSRILFGE